VYGTFCVTKSDTALVGLSWWRGNLNSSFLKNGQGQKKKEEFVRNNKTTCKKRKKIKNERTKISGGPRKR
jgi:hypothetical protein